MQPSSQIVTMTGRFARKTGYPDWTFPFFVCLSDMEFDVSEKMPRL
jgi:hypothetical protein